jgi:hypothetical protein
MTSETIFNSSFTIMQCGTIHYGKICDHNLTKEVAHMNQIFYTDTDWTINLWYKACLPCYCESVTGSDCECDKILGFNKMATLLYRTIIRSTETRSIFGDFCIDFTDSNGTRSRIEFTREMFIHYCFPKKTNLMQQDHTS